MKLISHRGNLKGKDKERENNPSCVDEVLQQGYDCEVDIRISGGIVHLGHDNPDYSVGLIWLIERKKKLWIHCKDKESMELMQDHKKLNYFWHDKDDMTLTSHGYAWVYPGKQPVKNSIAVLPEINNEKTDGCIGVCSDIIESYK